MREISKRSRFAGIMALVICLALMAGGCSAKEDPAPAGNAETGAIEENAAENAEDAAAAGVYAELTQNDKTIEITPVPGGITDSTVLPTFKCTFGDMTNEAQNALEEGRVFPKEFFRDLTACHLHIEIVALKVESQYRAVFLCHHFFSGARSSLNHRDT